MEAIGHVHTYAWGKFGYRSLVAQLSAANCEDFKIDTDMTYAELWCGNHPNGKAKIKATNEVITDDIPYLFKILCINKPLSVQVHPDKENAKLLHEQRPHLFPDPNYKPELVIALSPFVAMIGFRSCEEVYRFVIEIPPLRQLLEKNVRAIRLLENGEIEGLKDCYETIFIATKESIAECIDEISELYWKVLCTHEILEEFNKLNADFPHDVGVLTIFFTNVMRLEPGMAMFLPPCTIHSYICGDCIECMANSDNIIRGGLTNKFKDYGTLIAIANFEWKSKESRIYEPEIVDEYVKLFAPVVDYAVMEIKIPSSVPLYTINVKPQGTFILVLSGGRKCHVNGFDDVMMKRGSIIYVPPSGDTEINLICDYDDNTEFYAYLAAGNLPPGGIPTSIL